MYKSDRGLNAIIASVLVIAVMTIAAMLVLLQETRDERSASARPGWPQPSHWQDRPAPPPDGHQYLIAARGLPQYGHFGAAFADGAAAGDFQWTDGNPAPWPHRLGWPGSGTDPHRGYPLPWLPWYAGGTMLCMSALCILAIGARRRARRLALAGRALCAQLAFDEALLEGIPHPVYARDNAGRLVGCNSAFEKLLEARPGQWIGTTPEAFAARHLPAESAQAVGEAYARLLSSQRPLSADRTLVVGDRRIDVHHWAVPISSPEHGMNGLVGGFFDITDRQRSGTPGTGSLVPIAMISHEIRTPMNAVIGMLELLLHKNRLRGEARRYLTTAHGSANSLLALIDNVLDLSKIEAGRMEIRAESVRLPALVADVVRAFTPAAHARKLKLRTDLSKLAAKAHVVDPCRLRQILGNLISNAIKFSEHGNITVLLESLGQQDGTDVLRLSVADQGIGIDAEDVPRLFEPFFRAAASRAFRASGTGLGLPICRRLARQMGGELEITSTRGTGTVATLTLRLDGTAPNAPALAQPRHRQPEAALPRGFRVLLADDHDASRLLIQQQLTHLGIEATPANDGAQALALWFASSKSFDLLITDCNMPKVNGFELTRELRRQECARSWSRRPILGYSADVQPDNRACALEAGMDDCLGKPLGLDALREALRKLLPVARTEEIMLPYDNGPGVDGRVLDVLLDCNEADLAALVPAVAAGDWAQAGAMAHRIKGAARLDSATSVARCCEALETACGERDATAANTALTALLPAIAEWTQKLQARRSGMEAS